jgi:hypothetical protein
LSLQESLWDCSAFLALPLLPFCYITSGPKGNQVGVYVLSFDCDVTLLQ